MSSGSIHGTLCRMARACIAFDPQSGRRRVLIEAHPDLDVASESDLARFKRRLHGRRIHLGLLVTPEMSYFVRDTYATLEFSPGSYSVNELGTQVLMGRALRGPAAFGDGLYSQVKLWLNAVAASWSSFIPDEALPFMMPDMVGGLASSDLEEWDDVLDAADDAM